MYSNVQYTYRITKKMKKSGGRNKGELPTSISSTSTSSSSSSSSSSASSSSSSSSLLLIHYFILILPLSPLCQVLLKLKHVHIERLLRCNWFSCLVGITKHHKRGVPFLHVDTHEFIIWTSILVVVQIFSNNGS